MENKDYPNQQDLLNMSMQSSTQGYSIPQNYSQLNNSQFPNNMMFNPFMFNGQFNNFPQDLNKSTQNNFQQKNFNPQASNQSNYSPNPNMMFNYEMMQNMMRMYNQQSNPMTQMFGMNQMMNPMDYFAMQNAYNQMFLSNMNPMTPSNMNPQVQQLPDYSKQNTQNNMKFDELFNKNANELNKFYQYINTQNRESDPSRSDLSNTNRFDLDAKSVRTDTEPNHDDNFSKLNQSRNDDYLNEKSFQQGRGTRRPQTSNAEERLSTNPSHNNQINSMTPSFEDMRPIQGQQSQNANNRYFEEDERPLKPAQNNNTFDERPIRSGRDNFPQDYNEKPQRSSRSEYDEQPISRKDKRFQKVNKSISEEPDDEPQEAHHYHDEFDDLPITGKTKKFEDLLEEQLRNDPSALAYNREENSDGESGSKKGRFLKRGDGHVSSAALRPAKRPKSKKDQKENLSVDGFQEPVGKGFPGNRAFANNSQVNNQERPLKGGAKGGDLLDLGNDEPKNNASKEPKKFLARGGGTGGGKGSSLANLKSDSEDKEDKPSRSVSTRRGETKAPETTFDRINNYKYDEKKREPKETTEEEEDSFDKEYNMDKYAKNSAKKGKTPDSKSPAYQFDDENEFEDDIPPKKTNVKDFEPQYRPQTAKNNKTSTTTEKPKKETPGPVLTKSNVDIDLTGASEEVKTYVQGQLETLDSEIAKFKLENERVKREKVQYEDMIKNLQKKIDEWAVEREGDLKEFEDWKQEEMKRIKQMKKDAEKQNKASQSSSSKKERDEIDSLKKQIQKLSDDLQLKEKKAKSSEEHLKKQIDDLTAKNQALHAELKHFEQLRIKGLLGTPDSGAKLLSKHNKKPSMSQPKLEEENYSSNKFRDTENEDDEDDKYKYEDIFNAPRGTAKSAKGQATEEKKKADNSRQNKSPAPGRDKDFTLNTLSSQVKAETRDTVTPKKDADIRMPSFGKPSTSKNEDYEREEVAVRKNAPVEDEYKKHIFHKKDSQIVAQNNSDGKIQRIYGDGRKEVIFHNGVKREMMPDGYTIVYFTNSDIKQTLPDTTVIYYFAEAQTTQTTSPSGQQIYRFANNQVEYHNPDGTKEIFFADRTKKFIKANLEEETVFNDGTVQKINSQKIKTIEYQNGQKDVIYPDGLKIKSYPDGRVKKYYPDGNVEEY